MAWEGSPWACITPGPSWWFWPFLTPRESCPVTMSPRAKLWTLCCQSLAGVLKAAEEEKAKFGVWGVVLRWVNAPVHSVKLVEGGAWQKEESRWSLAHPPPPTPLTWPLQTFYFFQSWRRSWQGLPWLPKSSRRSGGQLLREATKEEFASTFTRWLEHWEKCVCIGGS